MGNFLNQSCPGYTDEPKYNLSYIVFDTMSSFRKVDRWFKIYNAYLCMIFFFCTSQERCIIFSQIMVAATAVESRNGVFQTSLDFEKLKALLYL